jgi:hypothetical protein
MDLAYKQMGVHVFMLVGYKDSEGNAVKAKSVDCISVLPFTYLIHFQAGNRFLHPCQEPVHSHV